MVDSRVVSCCWWLAYVALALLARVFTADGAQSLALVWPAAGAAVLWALSTRTRRGLGLSLAAMGLSALAVMTLTGSGIEAAVAVASSGVVQTLVCVVLVRRWLPDLLGTGGRSSVHDVRTLAVGVTAILVSTLLGAVLGPATLALLGVDVAGSGVLVWWARHLTGLLLVGSTAHLCWEALSRRSDPDRASVSWPGPVELVAMLTITAAGYATIFSESSTPVPFVLVVLAVWAGLRLPTWAAALHSAAGGTYAIAATIADRGPFAALDTPQTAAFVTQSFVLTVLLTTLAVAVGRDERAALVAQLESAKSETEVRVELLDAMTESMSEGIVVIDHEGRLTRTNRSARDVLSLSETGFRDHATEYRVQWADGSEMGPGDLPSERARAQLTEITEDLRLVGEDGSFRVLEVRATPLRARATQGEVAALVVYRDVTEERVARDRLAAFAETVAHDLRNPLTSTRGWIEAAEDLAMTLPAGRTYDGLEMALTHAGNASDRMAALIGDLLARAGGAPPAPRRVVLDGPDGLFARIAAETGVGDRLVVGAVPPVLLDPDLGHQLFTNLVGNAVKYVAAGVVPRVRVSGQEADGCVTIRVADNGIGVPEEERDRIFDRRHRSPGSAGAYEGTGLGLSICRDIVRRHGGSIRCERGGDGGSVFVVELPAA